MEQQDAWRVHHRHTGSAQWPLWPRRHVIRLLDPQGMVLDEVKLEARGAGVVRDKR